MRKFFLLTRLSMLALVVFCLTGCLSHWFLEGTTRLQIENQTNLPITGVYVMDRNAEVVRGYGACKENKDTNTCVHILKSDVKAGAKSWIAETVEPGERSRVVERDWVGDFTLIIEQSHQGSSLITMKSIELDGGSIYLVISKTEDGEIRVKEK